MTRIKKARPTYYRGHQMRSGLEAKFAKSLHAMKIDWRYEPAIVTLPSGLRYVPDFYLPKLGAWVEVKGAWRGKAGEKVTEFFDVCTARQERLYIATAKDASNLNLLLVTGTKRGGLLVDDSVLAICGRGHGFISDDGGRCHCGAEVAF